MLDWERVGAVAGWGWGTLSDNNGGDRPTQLLSMCFSRLRVWLERVCLLRISPFCTKRSGDLEIFRCVAVVAGLNAV